MKRDKYTGIPWTLADDLFQGNREVVDIPDEEYYSKRLSHETEEEAKAWNTKMAKMDRQIVMLGDMVGVMILAVLLSFFGGFLLMIGTYIYKFFT